MKKYIIVTAIALGALSVASCEKFLDVQSQGYPTQDQYFKNDQQAIDAVDACYRPLVDGDGIIGREIYWEQACANSIVWGRARNDMLTVATFNFTGDERIGGRFKWIYNEGMVRCNWVVQQLVLKQEKADLTPIEKRSLGEAYFLRAYYHFLIAYRYGTKDLGVPFVAYETVEGGYNNEIPEQQATVMEDFKLIISDLEKAEALVSKVEDYADADKGRVHKAAVAALMAKTYAYWATYDASQWGKVIECVNRLDAKTSGSLYNRDLVEDFAEIFTPDPAKFWHSEYCWGFPSRGGTVGGGVEFTGVCFVNGGYGKFNGWGQFKPTQDLYEEMEKDNVGGVKNYRLKVSIVEHGEEFPFWGDEHFKFIDERDNLTGLLIGKYLQALAPADPIAAGYLSSNGDFPTTSINFPIIRFADCLLLRAEAYLATNNVQKATDDINRVRTRSGLKAIDGASWEALYHERVCELALELTNDHFFDCKRWAYTGNTVTNGTKIQELAIAELNGHPRVRHYFDNSDPDSDYEIVKYPDYQNKNPWSDKYMTFPYPSDQINKSAGKLKNPPTWE